MNSLPCRLAAPLFFSVLVLPVSPAQGAPSIAEAISPDVYLVRDDIGVWGGLSTGMTHQRGPDYWAKKVLDLSAVPETFWREASQVRLSAFFTVRDYSTHDADKPNGLDETFEIVVNGHAHRVPTNTPGLPVFLDSEPAERCFRWHDFELPKSELVRGPNEILFRMAAPPGKKPDDYLYLGIDNTVPGGNSWVRFSKEAPWQQDRITVPEGGKGEYMVRLYLIRGERKVEEVWRALTPGPSSGAGEGRPAAFGFFDYAGAHSGAMRVEWDPERLDPLAPLAIAVETADDRSFELFWLDGQGKPIRPAVAARGPRFEATLSPPAAIPSGVQLAKTVAVKSIKLTAVKNYHPLARRIDIAPRIERAPGAPAARKPSCHIDGERVHLANDRLRCQFSREGGRLRMTSLYHELAVAEMARQPDQCALFMVEVGGKRYAGSREFTARYLNSLEGRQGFQAVLFCEPIGVEAALLVWIDADLHLSLSVTNRGPAPLDFKLAFPHLGGLAISAEPAGDYYFFPWGGGIIADAPALIRRGYGDHEAIYQVMDLFSPERGSGLAIWTTDDDRRHKVLALRKHVPGQPEVNADRARTPTADEFKWTNSLPAVPGTGLAYEYLRRTRKPGETFRPKDALLRTHAGDWHAAMRDYADWCHRVWRFRPYPSRLTPVHCMIAVGWGKDVLWRDGKYRRDFLRPRSDCVELMSWWEWSPLGPWGTPIDEVQERLGPAKHKLWESYFPVDPATGRKMFNNNPGDYDGYNRRWGGLATLREAIRSYQATGTLVTLYTDPLRVDGNSRCGQKWGKLWGVVQPDGKHRDDYDAWRMCHDVAEYRAWTAQTMRRVMQETGADGIRLDEYGHAGSACFSKLHQHTYAEWGNTEWQRGIAETTCLVRQAMDEVKPGSVLTTEHPGYDFLLPFIEGCITYDLSVQATPLRPLECNTQRFYFPECKAYELVYNPERTDGNHHRRFWNAVGSFGSHYPWNMYRVLRENVEVFASRDCEPLAPTLVRYVYANRFRAGEKTLYMLYNAAGHSVAGPVIALDLKPGEHVFDLLRAKEVEWASAKGGAGARVFLARDDVACLAQLVRRLAVKRNGSVLEVAVRGPDRGGELRICDADGLAIATQPVGQAAARFNLGELGEKARTAACVKLMGGERLLDAAEVPP